MKAAAGRDTGSGRVPAFVDRVRLPVDPWRLVETAYSADDLGTSETLFAVGNGYLGLRGNHEEGVAGDHGTFVNGFHETFTIHHAEDAFGFARVGQSIVDLPDPKVIRLFVDDEPLTLPGAGIDDYSRTLDFSDGVLTRELTWRTSSGNRVRIRSRRMVSFAQRHLAVMTYEVTVFDAPAMVALSSWVIHREAEQALAQAADAGELTDPRKAEALEGTVLNPVLSLDEADRVIHGYRCTHSGMTVVIGVDHTIETENEVEDYFTRVEAHESERVYRVIAQPGQPTTVTKIVAVHASPSAVSAAASSVGTEAAPDADQLADDCRETLDRVRLEGVQRQFADQRDWLRDFWKRSDVEVEGQPEVEQAIRFNLFALAQAAARAEDNGISAKGVTASGYGGHYFWDTEIYVIPFFVYTSPQIARNALHFRFLMLPAAARRATEMTQRGALFPWRTINGEEASAYFPAGTAAYHIDADIAFSVAMYVDASGDAEFLAAEGVDILVQTARLWADLGFWRNDGTDSFHIHGVTGPDEYSAIVNDNLYTNAMARFNLRRAALAVRSLRETRPTDYADLVSRLPLADGEVDEWLAAADAMAIPWDERRGIHPQDAAFLDHEVWDVPNTPVEKRPLLLHYHPLVIYRFQVLKQADVVLALFLQGDQFTAEQKRADFEYYDAITTGDSTLSGVVQSIMAAEVGYHELALRHFWDGLFVDLANLHDNTADGVHVASTGGVWSALVYGFGGMRDHGGVITFDPRLPASWPGLAFHLGFRGVRLLVSLRQDSITFTVEEGDQTKVGVRGQKVTVTREAPVTVQLDGQGPRLDGEPEPRALRPATRADGSQIVPTVPRGGDD